MRQIKRYLSLVVAFVMILCFSVTAFAAGNTQKVSYEKAAAELAEKYGVEITVTVLDAKSANQLSDDEVVKRINALEAVLIDGQKALQENNAAADAAWQDIVVSGRVYAEEAKLQDGNTRAAYTVYYYQAIGYVYPSASTIQYSVKANRAYNSSAGRYLWGSLISSRSSLYSGSEDKWKQTNSSTTLIDGGRTYYAQYWGDLTETRWDGIYQTQVTSNNWRIWFEASCPA